MHIIPLDVPNRRNSAGDFYFVGNPDSDQVIFILGSCRIIPYLNYLNHYNELTGNKYKIYCILPYAFNWMPNGKEVDYLDNITKLETNETLLKILASTKIFIHEHHANYGIFNTLDKHEKNIYQFGMKPELNICLPNWNDNFIYVNDLLGFDSDVKAEIASGKSVNELEELFYQKGITGFERFYKVCAQSDFPEFGEWFKDNFTKKRLFWNFNHITKNFSLEIFDRLNKKYLRLPLTHSFWVEISQHDHLEGNFTTITEMDRKLFNYEYD